jgi:alanine racemase
VGVVACGYADGYPRHAPHGTPVLVDGVRTTLVGRVSMDMMTVDLTPVPNAARRQQGHAVGRRPADRRGGHRRRHHRL